MTTISKKLVALRKARGVSQRVAASELEVLQSVLSHYETGIREPGLNFVLRACDYYNVSADELLGRSTIETTTPALPDSPEFQQFQATCILLWRLLDAVGGKEALSCGQDYVYDAIYKVFRNVYFQFHAEPQGLSIPSTDFSLLSDADMKLCELRLQRLLQNQENSRPVPSPEELSQDHPEFLQAFRALCASVRHRLSR